MRDHRHDFPAARVAGEASRLAGSHTVSANGRRHCPSICRRRPVTGPWRQP